jgi:hypothetical protein
VERQVLGAIPSFGRDLPCWHTFWPRLNEQAIGVQPVPLSKRRQRGNNCRVSFLSICCRRISMRQSGDAVGLALAVGEGMNNPLAYCVRGDERSEIA